MTTSPGPESSAATMADRLLYGKLARTLIDPQQAWYASNHRDGRGHRVVYELDLGLYYTDPGIGTAGEWSLEWIDQRDLITIPSLAEPIVTGDIAVRLVAFDDGWAAMAASGFLQLLPRLYEVTPDQAKAVLIEAGWSDETPVERPA
jgi:hypothetical protein